MAVQHPQRARAVNLYARMVALQLVHRALARLVGCEINDHLFDVERPPLSSSAEPDVHGVLVAAYEAVMRWPGVAFSRGSAGDQLKRALGSALCRYAEGYYAQGGNQSSLWASARASCGEAATAVLVLQLEWRVSAPQAGEVRELLARAMSMLSRLSRRG
ncbi:MAG: hypothetical protein HY744_07925 [Deltaproteobacteria bacterium]|nr:hypothetical protein [Deltaproteobacteria bacterium]